MSTAAFTRPYPVPKIETARPSTELSLWFASSPQFELVKTAFRSPAIPVEVNAVRGKTPRAYDTDITFQWTAAVHALGVFMLRAATQGERGGLSSGPIMEGGPGSIASSIDAALYKDVHWLGLLGGDANGDPLSRRVITRTNPGRRHAGPVTLSINEHLLPKNAIRIFVDGAPVRDWRMIERYADSLESTWNTQHSGIAEFDVLRLNNPLRLR